MKMWEGRLVAPLDPFFEEWQSSFSFDQRLLTYELATSRTHAKALQVAGILSQQELTSIVAGLDWIAGQAATDLSFLDDAEAEDVHHFVEKQLVKRIGETGYKLHSGRSRNEQIATDLRLYVRAQIDIITALLCSTIEALLERAEEAADRVMPGYTHLQRAEPVLLAHWLLAYVEMLFRDVDRLSDCRERANLCPLGSGAIGGSTLPLDRQAMAGELGFEAPTSNSMDATSDRDFALEFVQALSQIAIHLSRWAEEMVLYSSQEFGFVRLPDSYATGSSAMPQKKNPDALELIRGKAARVIADAVALAVTTKGLSLAYDKDLQETQPPMFHASETIVGMLRVAAGIIAQLSFVAAPMQIAAESGFLNATAAATYLARRGVPFRRAHENISAAVRLCVEKGCELQDLSLEELRQFGTEFDPDFYSAVELDSVLACHDVAGGTAPKRVRQALTQARTRLAALTGDVHAHA